MTSTQKTELTIKTDLLERGLLGSNEIRSVEVGQHEMGVFAVRECVQLS